MYAELQAMSLESANHTDDEVTNEKMRISFWPDLNFLGMKDLIFFGQTTIVHPRSYLT